MDVIPYEKPKAQYCFESSWEVCNKVGGIWTVITSKADQMSRAYKNYFLVGPYFKDKAEVEIIHKQEPDFLKSVFAEMKNYGITCYFGSWQIKGEPNVILIDFSSYLSHKDEIKTKLWDHFKVDSWNASWEFDEPVVWSYCVGLLLERLGEHLPDMVGHFHEWLSATALLHLKMQGSKVKTVFTTHATMLGRSLAGSGADLYNNLKSYNPTEEAQKSNIMPKHTMELAAANNADVFTTVSAITGLEAEHFYGRKPDVLLPNGLDMEKFPTIEDTSVRHMTNREKIRDFITYHFFPYYSFDLDHTLHFFILGRYEMHNKGVDVLISALAKLNERLKKEFPERHIVVFFFILRPHKGIKMELFENKNYYRHIKNYVESNSSTIIKNLVGDLVCGKSNLSDSVFTKEFMHVLQRDLHKFKRQGNPLLCTHNLEDEPNDQIVRAVYGAGLDNKEDDRVKIIFYPTMLDGNDSLMDLPYYDTISGCHLGLFPSYYEPWGYTPLEGAALGVPSLTTDLSGFGMYMKPSLKEQKGIYVLDRLGKPDSELVDDLANVMYEFAQRDHAERVDLKIGAKTLSNMCDWRHFIKHYIHAHNQAMDR